MQEVYMDHVRPVVVNNAHGLILVFDSESEMIGATLRLAQIATYGRKFSLQEASSGSVVMATTVMRSDINEFLSTFDESDMTRKEKEFIEFTAQADFVISMHSNECDFAKHELAHVLYHHDSTLRKAINEAWNNLDTVDKQLCAQFLSMNGYSESEIVDEWFAHLFCGFNPLEVEQMLEYPDVKSVFEQIKGKLDVLTGSGG